MRSQKIKNPRSFEFQHITYHQPYPYRQLDMEITPNVSTASAEEHPGRSGSRQNSNWEKWICRYTIRESCYTFDAMWFAKRGKTHEENREKRGKSLYDNIKMTDAFIYRSTWRARLVTDNPKTWLSIWIFWYDFFYASNYASKIPNRWNSNKFGINFLKSFYSGSTITNQFNYFFLNPQSGFVSMLQSIPDSF